MAITVSGTTYRGPERGQFQAQFTELFGVTATLAFAEITAGAEDTGAITVPGVALGDAVIAYSFNLDAEPNVFAYQVIVSAANTVEVTATNLSGSSDTPAPTNIKVLVGRPAW